jgi:hypothetical protein
MTMTQMDDPLLKAADNLVSLAKTNADAMLTPLLGEYSSLGRAPAIKHWVQIVTIASVFIATTRLDAREKEVMDKVYDRFTQWDKNAMPALEDCASFFAKHFDEHIQAGHEPRSIASDGIGLWVIWNVFERPPQTDEEVKLVRVIGAMITNTFFDYWGDQTSRQWD